MLKHRQTTLKGFIECANPMAIMKAKLEVLLILLRFKHKKPIANLPFFKPMVKKLESYYIPDNRFCLLVVIWKH
jgi:hypothetical protein